MPFLSVGPAADATANDAAQEIAPDGLDLV
jgi:hypothetical protein